MRGRPSIKFNTIVSRYIFKELLPPFSINLGFFTFIFLMTRILEITNLIVNYRVSFVSMLWMLVYSMPFFLVFIIPMSVMMAVLLTFLQMSGDNEITALKSGGLSLYRLLPPVILFCCLGGVATAYMAIYGMPWGKRSFHETALQLATQNANAGLKERTFNDSFDGIMLYVSKIDKKTKELIHVFVEQKKTGGTATTIVAPRGLLFSEPGKKVFHLRLFDGTINQVDLGRQAANTTRFDVYEISLDLDEAMQSALSRRKDLEEMGLSELRQVVRTATEKNTRYYTALMRYHEKFAIPFACLALGLLAVPLGLQSKTDKRSFGVVIGLLLFFFYYVILSIGYSMGESGTYPPAVGMWMPNIIMFLIGSHLLARSAKDKPVRFDLPFYYLKLAAGKFIRLVRRR